MGDVSIKKTEQISVQKVGKYYSKLFSLPVKNVSLPLLQYCICLSLTTKAKILLPLLPKLNRSRKLCKQHLKAQLHRMGSEKKKLSKKGRSNGTKLLS